MDPTKKDGGKTPAKADQEADLIRRDESVPGSVDKTMAATRTSDLENTVVVEEDQGPML